MVRFFSSFFSNELCKRVSGEDKEDLISRGLARAADDIPMYQGRSKKNKGSVRVNTIDEALKHACAQVENGGSEGTLLFHRTVKRVERLRIMEGFLRSHHWLTLDLSSNSIGGKEEAAMLARELSEKSLAELYLCHCNLQLESARALAQILKKNKYLITLDISRNPFLTADGASSIFEAMKESNLSRFIAYSCKFSEQSAKMICDAMRSSKLVYLDLSRNKLGLDGVSSIGKSLNATLVTLKLNHCHLRNEAVNAFCESLENKVTHDSR